MNHINAQDMFSQFLSLKAKIQSDSGRFVMLQRLSNGKIGVCSAHITPYDFVTIHLEDCQFVQHGVYKEDDVVYVYTTTPLFSDARQENDEAILAIADEVLKSSKLARIAELEAELAELKG